MEGKIEEKMEGKIEEKEKMEDIIEEKEKMEDIIEEKEKMEVNSAETGTAEGAAPAKKRYPCDKRLKIFQPRILGYILFYLLESTGIYLISLPLGWIMPKGFDKGGIVIAALVMLLINKLYCLPHYRGMLTFKNLGKGLGMGVVFFGICIALNLISSAKSGLIGTGNEFLRALVLALTAGVGEEVMFRGPVIANFMRVTDDEKKIPLIFWISSIAFGLIHLGNLSSGANVPMTVVQVITAVSAGMMFAAIFLRTGNLLPCIIFHTLVDLACFMDKSLLEDSGVITASITLIDWIYLAVSIPMAIWALKLVAKKHRGEILAVWAERWKK